MKAASLPSSLASSSPRAPPRPRRHPLPPARRRQPHWVSRTGSAERSHSLDVTSKVALSWNGDSLTILDQTLLPAQEVKLALHGAADTAAAIKRLAVRGAPLIGVAGAYGLALEVAREPSLGALEDGWALLRDARPTAVNLAWAVDRVRTAA